MNLAESEKIWVVHSKEKTFGPVSAYEVKLALREEKISGGDHIWKNGWGVWKQINLIPLFTFESSKQPISEATSQPAVPVPSADEFTSVILPLVSASDIKTVASNWDSRRIAWVGAWTVVAGPVAGLISAAVTSKGVRKRQQAKAEEYSKDSQLIAEKNK